MLVVFIKINFMHLDFLSAKPDLASQSWNWLHCQWLIIKQQQVCAAKTVLALMKLEKIKNNKLPVGMKAALFLSPLRVVCPFAVPVETQDVCSKFSNKVQPVEALTVSHRSSSTASVSLHNKQSGPVPSIWNTFHLCMRRFRQNLPEPRVSLRVETDTVGFWLSSSNRCALSSLTHSLNTDTDLITHQQLLSHLQHCNNERVFIFGPLVVAVEPLCQCNKQPRSMLLLWGCTLLKNTCCVITHSGQGWIYAGMHAMKIVFLNESHKLLFFHRFLLEFPAIVNIPINVWFIFYLQPTRCSKAEH